LWTEKLKFKHNIKLHYKHKEGERTLKKNKSLKLGLIIGGALLLVALGIGIFMMMPDSEYIGYYNNVENIDDINEDHEEDDDYAYIPAPDTTYVGDAKERNLRGMEIIVANWWGDYDTDTFEAIGDNQQAILEARRELEERYNFRLREVNIGDQATVAQIATETIESGNPDAHIFVLSPTSFVPMNINGFFASLDGSAANFGDVSEVNWNYAMIDATMRNNIPHGWSQGGTLEGDGLFFNMRILEEAGVDSEFLFDLQSEGNWNWNYFLEVAQMIGDNAGAMTLVATPHDFLQQTLTSNGTGFVGYDPETGRFYNPMTTTEFIQAMEFAQSIFDEGIAAQTPEGASWDWHYQAFINGNAAMMLSGAYILPLLAAMEDSWGFVAFPAGPATDRHHFMSIGNIHAIPHTFTSQEADDILFAWQIWTAAAYNADDYNAWIASALHAHYHSRSVHETLRRHLRNPENAIPMLQAFVPGLQTNFISDLMWREDSDIERIIEDAQPLWESLINMANN